MSRLTQDGLSEQLEGIVSPGALDFGDFLSGKKLVLIQKFTIRVNKNNNLSIVGFLLFFRCFGIVGSGLSMGVRGGGGGHYCRLL